MINLIPPAAKRVMVREYWMRVGVVYTLLLAGVLLVVACLLVPAFVLVDSQLNAYESQIVEAEARVSQQQELVDDIKLANDQAAHLNEVAQIRPIQPYIDQIDARRSTQVQLAQLIVARVETEVSTITISGVASTRESLAAFRDLLLAAPEFTNVELPLSSLAANTDNPFSMVLTVAPPQ